MGNFLQYLQSILEKSFIFNGKQDAFFQIVDNVVHNARKKPSILRIVLLEAIHEAFQSQLFILIMNYFRLCTSCDEVLIKH